MSSASVLNSRTAGLPAVSILFPEWKRISRRGSVSAAETAVHERFDRQEAAYSQALACIDTLGADIEFMTIVLTQLCVLMGVELTSRTRVENGRLHASFNMADLGTITLTFGEKPELHLTTWDCDQYMCSVPIQNGDHRGLTPLAVHAIRGYYGLPVDGPLPHEVSFQIRSLKQSD